MFDRFVLATLLGTLCSVVSCNALALCSLLIPAHRYVGSDVNCSDADIQSAIDNVVCPGTIVVVTTELAYPNQAITIDN